jgi:hypothetical protein
MLQKPVDLTSLNLQDNSVTIKDDSDSENDLNTPVADVPVTKEKHLLMRELKALGYKPMPRPDYTKPLDEEPWGGEEDEDDDDFVADEMEEDEDDEMGYEEIEELGDEDEDVEVKGEDSDDEMKF